jgi:hypothetical protein
MRTTGSRSDETDLVELLAQADVQAVVGIPKACFNVVGARRQQVVGQSMGGSGAVSV